MSEIENTLPAAVEHDDEECPGCRVCGVDIASVVPPPEKPDLLVSPLRAERILDEELPGWRELNARPPAHMHGGLVSVSLAELDEWIADQKRDDGEDHTHDEDDWILI